MQARREFVEKLSAGTDLTAMVRDFAKQLRSSRAEVDELRSQLELHKTAIEALRESPGVPERPTPKPQDSAQSQASLERAQKPPQEERRSWWKKMLGG